MRATKEASAIFTGELLGLPPPHHAGPFATVQVDAELSLDFIDTGGTTRPQHDAFLVTEAEFDAIFACVRERGLTCWADSHRREAGLINTWGRRPRRLFRRSEGPSARSDYVPLWERCTTTQSPNPLFTSETANA